MPCMEDGHTEKVNERTYKLPSVLSSLLLSFPLILFDFIAVIVFPFRCRLIVLARMRIFIGFNEVFLRKCYDPGAANPPQPSAIQLTFRAQANFPLSIIPGRK